MNKLKKCLVMALCIAMVTMNVTCVCEAQMVYEHLEFEDKAEYDIPEGEIGTDYVSPISLTAKGGVPPYFFKIVDGVKGLGINIHNELVFSREPEIVDETTETRTATVMVIDNDEAYKTITINIGRVKKDPRPAIRSVKSIQYGNGSILPFVSVIPEGSAQTFSILPSHGEIVKSVTFIQPDGTEHEVIGIPESGGNLTIKGDNLDLGQSKLVAEFTSKNVGRINDSAVYMENWSMTIGNSAKLTIFINGDGTTNLYKNRGNHIDSDYRKEQLIFEDTLPSKGIFENLSIRAVLPDWGDNDGDTFAEMDLGAFEDNNSFDIIKHMNKLNQYSDETYDHFKTRVQETPMNWGIYTGADKSNTLVINFGSPSSPFVEGAKYSDYSYLRFRDDPKLNQIAGDGNCVGGKVQYFSVMFNATHMRDCSSQHLLNTVSASYVDADVTEQKQTSNVEYDIGYEEMFTSGEKGHIVINMCDEDNLSMPLAGAEFKLQIKDDGDNYVDYTGDGGGTDNMVSGVTNECGMLDLKTLVEGEYRLVETRVPTGYEAESARFRTAYGSFGPINEDGTFTVSGSALEDSSKGFGVIITNTKTVVPPPVSVWEEIEAVASTCTDQGHNHYWRCKHCGKYFKNDKATETTVEAEKRPMHTLIHHDAVAATQTAAGNIEYWTCDVCGKYFKDAMGTIETNEDGVVAPKLPIWEEIKAVDSTCIVQGNNHYWYLVDDGKYYKDDKTTETTVEAEKLPLSPHALTHHDAVAATQTATGNIEYWTCDVCEKYFKDATGTIETAADAVVVAQSSNSNIFVNQITLTGESKQIAKGKKLSLTAMVLPIDATNNAITWSTSNAKYASVDANGKVSVYKAGQGKYVTITATAQDGSGIKATYRIKIMKGVVKRVKITGAKSVKAGRSLRLKVRVTASKGANKKVKWTSSNTKYATVSSSGKVKALNAGKNKTLKIKARATDGSNKSSTLKIKIK